MKTLTTTFIALISASVFGQMPQAGQQQAPVQVMQEEEVRGDNQDVYKRQTTEQVGGRQQIQTGAERGQVEAQLQQVRDNVKTDEVNIQKAEQKKKQSEAQVDVDKASIKKYEAQLQEDKAQLKKLEDQLGDQGKQKQEKKGLFD